MNRLSFQLIFGAIFPFCLFFCLIFATSLSADELCLEVTDAPDSGLVLVSLKPGAAATAIGCDAEKLRDFQVELDAKPISSQYVGREFLVLKLDAETIRASKKETLQFLVRPVLKDDSFFESESSRDERVQDEVVTKTSAYVVRQSASQNGGFPNLLQFVKTGKSTTSLLFRDRVQELGKAEADRPFFGGWELAQDSAATLEVVSDGPICRVVRQNARYAQKGKAAPGDVKAVYDWFFFKENGLVYVLCRALQTSVHAWDEHHFFELHVKDATFSRLRWKTNDQKSRDEIHDNAPDKAHDEIADKPLEKNDVQGFFPSFGAFHDGQNFIGFPPESGYYDGKTYGPYLHARIRKAWSGWETPEKNDSAWLLLDSFNSPEDFDVAAEKFLVNPFPCYAKITLRHDSNRPNATTSQNAEPAERWRESLAFSILLSGKPDAEKVSRALLALPVGQEKDGLLLLTSRDLAMLLSKTREKGGFSLFLLGLADRKTGLCFTNGEPQPLFSTEVRETETGRSLQFNSGSVWKEIVVAKKPGTADWLFTFQAPINNGRGTVAPSSIPNAGQSTIPSEQKTAPEQAVCVANPLEWTLQISADSEKSALEISWSGKTNASTLSFMRVCAGQIVCEAFGGKTCALYPNTSGILIPRPFSKAVSRKQPYPAGWCVMPWMAIWDENAERGIYVGLHDPKGSVKTVDFVSEPLKNQVALAFTYPVPNMTEPGNEVASSGKFVLQPFDGSWFDAALIYRGWVRENAEWFPELGPEGRRDSPMWMKRLSVWAQGGGTPDSVVKLMKDFRDAFGVPCAIHWYCWHKSPFDNDYPHYVPSDGFRDAVNEIQKDGDIFVMPYVNGRLWDTRDRGMEDFQFSSVAKPATTKNEAGDPIVETYGSKEADGSKVQLGVMCPATMLWQEKVASIIRSLMNEQCVKAVYVDQIAAAPAVNCMDPTHGHPLGGGSWWVEAYAKMMRKIREEMKASGNEFSPGSERMLTSECNAETYANQFDGLLTWHLQSDQAVPAFSAVYGGAVQMFGRSYAGDDVAVRMKAAQQLVFGEQIGWFSPATIHRKEVMEYLRPLVRFRSQIAPYFFMGEMARPANLIDPIPSITADWKWHGPTPVSMETVQSSAWRILEYPEGERRDWKQGKVRRMIFIFTNFSESPVKSRLGVHLDDYGFTDLNRVKVEKIAADGSRTPLSLAIFSEELEFAPFQTWGIEILDAE